MIELKNITKKFKSHTALNDLTLTVKTGEVYGLLGANGAGKSTTINLILGFLEVDSGSIQIGEQSSTSSGDSTQIGYIPENVNLYPYLSGLENLDYFTRLAGRTCSKEELGSLLIKCGLQQEAHTKRLSEYSKGMRQKVGIAIALFVLSSS